MSNHWACASQEKPKRRHRDRAWRNRRELTGKPQDGLAMVMTCNFAQKGEGVLCSTTGTTKLPHLRRLRNRAGAEQQGWKQPFDKQEVMMAYYKPGRPPLVRDRDPKTGEYKSYSGYPLLVNDKDPKTGQYKSYSGYPLLVNDKDPKTGEYKSYSGYPLLKKD
ncbi:hypothetical protein [uncultured Rhodoblastus sp.]|uniref:hypothetical protein n=1 Tax=uncultured Rhodoblastus sp. TaxID=543037 RepID=UPI0025F3CF44|nr:hypothetical protein [uncultured Rhodoblastus sp.]